MQQVVNRESWNLQDRKRRFHYVGIFLLFFIIFAGSTLLHSRQHTGLLRDSVETLTIELSGLLTDNYLMEARLQEDNGDISNWKFPEGMVAEDCAEWFLDKNGEILQQSDPTKEIPTKVMKQLSLAKLNDYGDYQVIWSGNSHPLLFTQNCFVVSAFPDRDMYLVVENQAISVKATQRSQFALAAGVNLVLFIVIIVIIYNVISGYRRQILQMATTDELTGLSNRKFFHRQYEEFVQDIQRPEASLFLLDVDHFKEINDTLGHLSGDKALSGLAEQIRDMILESGGFAGRWGGDEFIGVLPVQVEQAERILEELCRKVVQAETNRGFPMSVSVGLTEIPRNAELAKVTEKADEALYQSKENGRNQISVYHERSDSVQADHASEAITIDSISSLESKADGIIRTHIKNEGLIASEVQVTEDSFWQNIDFRTLRKKLAASIVLGVKWMIPFVAGGGILIALAFLFDAAAVDIANLPFEERSKFGSITAMGAMLKQLGDTTFNFMLPVFAGFMAFGLAGENAFMAGFVGGFMTIGCNTGFAGAMIAGLIAGLITIQMNAFSRHLPRLIRKIAPIVIFPIINLLVLQALTSAIISPVSAAIGTLFTNLLDYVMEIGPTIGGGIVAMMMSIDMGGIINKVAYQYGLDSITANQTNIMACVMIGGMVPPIGIALSMLLFRHKYTVTEQDSAPVTMVMGLSFITEGALPYVFTDFVRVIPACMVGAFTAGILSSVFDCRLPAPHGGMFVIPVIEHALMYIVALVAGSLVTALILGFLKKDQNRSE